MTEQDVYGVIYVIENKVNGKKYVGQTIRDIKVRFKEHRTKAQGHSVIHKAIKKYGQENFRIEQIDSVKTLEELNEKEIYWINKLNSMVPSGYNVTEGGFGHQGVKYTPEQLERKRNNMLGEKNPMWGRFGKKNHFYGQRHSEETKKKMSEVARERFKDKESHPMYGKKGLTGKDNPVSIKVICIETEEVFDSATEAVRKYNLNTTAVSEVIRGRQSTAGGYHWAKYDDWISGIWEYPRAKPRKGKRVINLNTDEVYISVPQASKETGVKKTTIRNLCYGKVKTIATENWMYYEDYLKEKENRGTLNGG